MATTTKFAVHSFHINIDIGDAAIHLLVDETTSPPTCMKAVLIDGGISGPIVYAKTKGIIKEIETVYTPDTAGHFDLFGPAADNAWLRFDAIIITHFDYDHYGGVSYLINDGFLPTVQAEAAKLVLQVQNAIADATDPWPTLKTDQKAWVLKHDVVAKALDEQHWVQNRYMKYTSVVPGLANPPNSTDELLTTLYAPYVTTAKKIYTGFICRDGYDDSKCWKTPSNVLGWDCDVKVSQINNLPKGAKNALETGGLRTFQFENVCKVVASPPEYLGVDVFFNQALQAGDWANVQNPGLLIKKQGLKLADGPRMYIVAGLQVVLGNKQTAVIAASTAGSKTDPVSGQTVARVVQLPQFQTGPGSLHSHADASNIGTAELALPTKPVATSNDMSRLRQPENTSSANIVLPLHGRHGSERILDEPGKGPDPGSILSSRSWTPAERNNDSFAKNTASICCMVLSSTNDTDNAKAFKALHYLGGDALWDTETAIALWASPDNTTLDIEAMKMSHHGAMASLPIAMLDTFKPKRIIGSVGSGSGLATKYGHPRSELMLYLAAWLRKWKTIDPTRPTEAIFTTNYPGYLNVHGRYKKVITIPLQSWTLETGDKENSPTKVWRARLKDLCDQARIINHTENVLAGWTKQYYDFHDPNYDLSKSQAKMTDLIVQLYNNWEGSKSVHRPAPGSGINAAAIPRCIELRLSPNPGPTLANTWRGLAPAGRLPFHVASVTIADSDMTSVRLVETMQVDPIVIGDRKRSLEPPPPVGNRTSTLGDDGEAASKRIKVERPDTMVLEIQETTDDTGPGGVADGDEEAGFFGRLFNVLTNLKFRSAMAVPMGAASRIHPDHIELAASTDPFTSQSASAVPTMLSTAIVANSDGLIRLYATSFQSEASQFGAQEVLLSGTGNAKLSSFVDVLPLGYLTCNVPVALSTEYQLVPNDEYLQRLVASSLGFNSFSVSGTIVQPTAGNGQTSPTMQVQAINAVLSIKNNNLTFSSTASTLVCGLPATSSTYSDALLDTHTILTLGISSSTPTISVSLSDLVPLRSRLTVWTALFSIADLTLSVDPSPNSRTAVSFQPGSSGVVWRRLQLIPSDKTWTLATHLPFLEKVGIVFSDHQIILRSQVTALRDSLTATTTRVDELVIRTTVNINTPANFQATIWWVFGDNTTSLVVTFTEDQDLEGIVSWVVNLLNTNENASFTEDDIHPNTLFSDMPNTKSPGETTLKAFIQQISLTLTTSTGGAPSIDNFSIVFEVDLFGAAFIVQVSGPPITLSAKLWSYIPDTSVIPKPGIGVAGPYVPYLEDYQTLHPFGDVVGDINLTQLIGSDNTSSPPAGIQVDITELGLDLQRSDGSTKATFNGTILCDEPASADGFPDLNIASFSIYAEFETAGPTTQKSYDIKLITSIFLCDLRNPKPADQIVPARLEVSAEASNGVWTFTASATDLQFGALYQLFDKDASDSVVDVLSHLSIPELDLTYVYSSTSPNTLSLTGALVVGSLELELNYMYTAADKTSNTPKTWSIEAFLGAVGETTHTIGSVVSGLDPDIGGFLEQVPFVRDCSLPVTPPVDAFDDTGFVDAPIQLFCANDGTYTVMCFRIEILTDIGALSCTCVRFQPVALGNVTVRPKPKMILRVSLDKLSAIPKIPVVGSLPQPVDDIDYIFVRDPNAAMDVPSGVTDIELAAVNAILATGHFTDIPARQVQSDFKTDGTNPAPSAAKYVLLAGHHFMVRAEGRTIVDHFFGGGSGPAPAVPQQIPNISQRTVATQGSRTDGGLVEQETATTSGDMKKTFGPLTISNFGIQIKNGYLYFILDLSVAMGPIQMTITGFGVGVLLRSLNLNQLAHLSADDFSIIFSGMSVYGNAPPVLIGGVFIDKEDATQELYEGGLTVSIPPYTLVAVGAYRHQKPNGFKSVFVFARFDGPLLSLEFAEISGVEAGFGYNYDLSMPDANNILDYPLLHSQVGTNNPMDILTQFGTWNVPSEGHFWFAIGCKVDAFELISMDAAIMIAFSVDGDFKVGLAGLATASMPPMVTKREEAFLYVELGVVGAVDIGKGSMWIEASLTPNSFILYPDCHLTGGFALCYWFPPSPYSGDWVFTVGGYHPAFKPPSYYPQVDLVGISWNLSDCLTVRGGAFFAITPNAAMAGGSLKANFDAWFVSAYFEASAMMLIKFKPLFFIVDIDVTIGCSVHLNLGLIHFGFSIDISGSLHLSGPRFGGTVYVDLKIHRFGIDFGDQDNTPDALDWPNFLNTVRQSGPKAATGGETTDLIIALVDGSATENTKSTQSAAATTDPKSAPSTWSVRSGSFVFRVECKVPVDDVSVSDGTPTGRTVTASSNPSPTYARLMENTMKGALDSSLTVTVKPATAAADADNNSWQLTPMIKNLPLALWDKYDSLQDPLAGGSNNITSQLNPSSNPTAASHCTGYIITTPKPALPLPEHILPEFNAAAAMEEGVFPDGGTLARKDRRPLNDPAIKDDLRPRIIKADGVNVPGFAPQERPAGLGTPVEQWNNVKNTWSAANVQDAQILLDAWTDVLGWADPKIQVAPIAPAASPGAVPAIPVYPTPPFTALQAGVPAQVLVQFNEYFLGLPQVCVGGGG